MEWNYEGYIDTYGHSVFDTPKSPIKGIDGQEIEIGVIQHWENEVDGLKDDPDAPYRFLPCTVSGLAYYLSQEVAVEKSQELERRYEAELQRALTEDSQSTSVNIVPRSFYVG